MTGEPDSPGAPRLPWSPGLPACGPAPATSWAMPSASRCGSWDGAEFLDGQLECLDELIAPLAAARAPGLLALYRIGPRTAACLLIADGDHPGRLRPEPAWAHLCAVAPTPASSGKVTRHRHGPGGDRQASHALWRIVFTRMGSDAATRAYVERRMKEGKSTAEIIRCLKRYVAREVCAHLRPAAG